MSDKLYEHKNNCMVCKNTNSLVKFLSFGQMPEAGSFLKKEEILDEKKFPLEVYFCENCKMVQLLDIVNPDYLYKDYRYASSTTNTLKEHFKEYAHTVFERFDLDNNSLVVDIGSNDGVLLLPFMELGVKSIGFEPSENISEIARSKGTNTLTKFFHEQSAKELCEKVGKAKIITTNNTMASIYDTDQLIKGVKELLDDKGAFIFEVHYLLDLIKDFQFDQIYHQHMYYYAITPLKRLFARHGMEVFDVTRLDTHGGSIRVFTQFKDGPNKIMPTVDALVDEESKAGLHDINYYHDFSKKISDLKESLVSLLKDLKSKGNKIAIYGTPGKGNTLLNFCNIGKELIDFAIDASPERYNRYIPGMHIPIYPPEKFKENYPDYALMLAFTYKDEILAKEKDFMNKGGKFIIPIPKVEVIS